MKKILILLLVVAGFTSCKVATQDIVIETEKPVKEKPRGTHKVSDLRAYCLDNVGFEIVSPNLLCNQSESEAEWTIEELETLLKEVEKEGEQEIAEVLKEKIKELENRD